MVHKRGKHDDLIRELYDRLKYKPYVKNILMNVHYPLGECDLLVHQGNKRVIYYQVKTNHTKKGYNKCIKQLKRWSGFYKAAFNDKDYYGIYYAPGKLERICKNGILKK